MNAVRLLSPAHTRSPMWVMWKVFIYCLLWLVEYQCKGVVKFNLSDLFFWGHFQRSWKKLNCKNFLLTLIAVTRIINLIRCISQFKCFKFSVYVFYFRPTLFFKKEVICWDEQYLQGMKNRKVECCKTVRLNHSTEGTSWQIVDFMFTFEDFWFLEGLSIKRKLLSCTNGVHFIEIPLWVLKDTLNTTKDSRHPWRTHIGVKGSDRGPFILILDLILVHAT